MVFYLWDDKLKRTLTAKKKRYFGTLYIPNSRGCAQRVRKKFPRKTCI